MPGESSRQVLRQLNTLFHCGVAGPLRDKELLEQFVAGSEESAEAAFTALVDRHGAMVLGVCRRVLGNRHAAEDAFQATFLVLARKASEIARREQLASWLYGVARRAALDARARAARRHAREKRLSIMSSPESIDEIDKNELSSILDEELGRLPERHRAAIVLCELEGLSRREAAGRLGVSEGTLSSRLARAKTRLRERLSRRGLALSAAILASALTQDVRALTVPPSLVNSTIQIATLVASGSSLAGVTSAPVVTLTEGVLKAMLLSKLKFAFLALVTVALVMTGAGVVAQDRPSDDDRLKNLERKVDKLLEVLGGSNRHSPAPNPTPDSRPGPIATAPALAPLATPAAPATIATVPQPPQPPSAFKPVAPASPRAEYPVVAAATPYAPPQIVPPGMAPPTPPSEPSSLARRVDSLEHRLAKLEKRMAEFERRLSGVNSGLPLTPASENGLNMPRPAREIPADLPRNATTVPPTLPAPTASGVPTPDDSLPPPSDVTPAAIPAGSDLPAPPTEPAEPALRSVAGGSGELAPESPPATPGELPPDN